MRLFIGTQIDAATAELIRKAASLQLKEDAWRAAPVDQWHVTALFIGERPEHELDKLKAHVKRIAKGTPRMTLTNGKLCTEPRSIPRMLWVKFDPASTLNSLHLTLATALGAEPSKHYPYLPHITLARAKGSPDEVDGPLLLPQIEIDHLSLFHTELHPSGSLHHRIANWKLK
jgi:2'-5' RNA ligase